jgi:hypothetical protein
MQKWKMPRSLRLHPATQGPLPVRHISLIEIAVVQRNAFDGGDVQRVACGMRFCGQRMGRRAK